jgi:hypothetical protein
VFCYIIQGKLPTQSSVDMIEAVVFSCSVEHNLYTKLQGISSAENILYILDVNARDVIYFFMPNLQIVNLEILKLRMCPSLKVNTYSREHIHQYALSLTLQNGSK